MALTSSSDPGVETSRKMTIVVTGISVNGHACRIDNSDSGYSESLDENNAGVIDPSWGWGFQLFVYYDECEIPLNAADSLGSDVEVAVDYTLDGIGYTTTLDEAHSDYAIPLADTFAVGWDGIDSNLWKEGQSSEGSSIFWDYQLRGEGSAETKGLRIYNPAAEFTAKYPQTTNGLVNPFVVPIYTNRDFARRLDSEALADIGSVRPEKVGRYGMEWTYTQTLGAELKAGQCRVYQQKTGLYQPLPLPRRPLAASNDPASSGEAADPPDSDLPEYLDHGFEYRDEVSAEVEICAVAVVVPPAPQQVESGQCGVESIVTVPEAVGAVYTTSREGNRVTVTAAATEGYVVEDGTPVAWTFDVSAEECPVVPIPSKEPPATLPKTGIDGLPLAEISIAAVASIVGGIGLRRRSG